MSGCFVGRGSLLVSLLGTSGGFFTLSGESEINVNFEEVNESILDARNGVNERIDWYVRNYNLSIEAECFRVEPAAIELLLKAAAVAVAGNATPITLVDNAIVGREYMLRPSITGPVTVVDSVAAPVNPNDYVVDLVYGTIEFLTVAAYNQPFTVSLTSGAYDAFALNDKQQIFVEAMLKGFNKITDQKVMAHFYRLAVDVTEEFKMVQKGFSSMSVRLQALPDVTQPIDPTLGQYGRILLL